MAVPVGAQAVLDRLAGTPGEIRTLLVALDEGPRAEAANRTTGWSPAEVVIHLAAVDAEVWDPRLRELAVDPSPAWAWTEPEVGGWAAPSPTVAVNAFAAGRRALLELVAGLPAEAWLRTGTHAVFGPLDATGLLREALVHDDEHLAALRVIAGVEEAEGAGAAAGAGDAAGMVGGDVAHVARVPGQGGGVDGPA